MADICGSEMVRMGSFFLSRNPPPQEPWWADGWDCAQQLGASLPRIGVKGE
jgi:hypothetical protein